MFDHERATRARHDQGLTVAQVADAAGVTQRTILRYLAGDTQPDHHIGLRIERFLGFEPGELDTNAPVKATA